MPEDKRKAEAEVVRLLETKSRAEATLKHCRYVGDSMVRRLVDDYFSGLTRPLCTCVVEMSTFRVPNTECPHCAGSIPHG